MSIENYLRCPNGIIVKNFFLKHKRLDDKHRNLLTNVIIHKEFEYFNGNAKMKITTDRFLAIVNEIKIIFPGENDLLYYVPYNKFTGQRACGKLWDCYNHLKRKLFTTKETPVLEADAALKKKLEYLANHCNDLNVIEEYWNETRSYRNNYLEQNQTDNIHQYFQQFCILSTARGIKLLLDDFYCRYPSNKILLTNVWPNVNTKLIKYAGTKKNKDLQNIISEPHSLTGFLILNNILSNSAYKRDCNKRIKLSKVEVLKSFLCLVSV